MSKWLSPLNPLLPPAPPAEPDRSPKQQQINLVKQEGSSSSAWAAVPSLPTEAMIDMAFNK
ncbi:MAG: hypothetical protein Q8P67_19850 [archaeon]|nr:hypothetical protein [archaeon]